MSPAHITSLGLLAQVTDARGQIASYQYDDAGRLSSLTDQTGVTTYTYDANGNLLTVSDSSGVITRAYDPLNRVTKLYRYPGEHYRLCLRPGRQPDYADLPRRQRSPLHLRSRQPSDRSHRLGGKDHHLPNMIRTTA